MINVKKLNATSADQGLFTNMLLRCALTLYSKHEDFKRHANSNHIIHNASVQGVFDSLEVCAYTIATHTVLSRVLLSCSRIFLSARIVFNVHEHLV